MPSPIVFRPEDASTQERLKRWADANGRTVSTEMRAAVSIYLRLLELAHLRGDPKRSSQELALLERRIRDDIGRMLLPAISTDANMVFEEAADVAYPADDFGPVAVPFDEVITWVVTGRTSDEYMSHVMKPVPEAHFGLDGPVPHGESAAVLRVLGSEAKDWSPLEVSAVIADRWGDVMRYDAESVAAILHALYSERYIFAVAPGLYRLHRWA
jgi:hypothetical protein